MRFRNYQASSGCICRKSRSWMIPVARFAHAGVIEAGIYGSRRVVLTDAGHLMYLEKPEGFSSVVISFVESNLR